ncbi:ParA family protein [Salinibacter altiplanensis]|uniref:ParA family protein n=1 Tax=Salinibacter altiplanensis TaxID=1803181 RepID=UPI000C9FCB3E|nr:AAA family ATPase [Salinibacter altiplanensis]
MKIVSVVNMKGGVAKTTLAVNIADCLAREHDKSVLLVDIDPQFNATQCLVSGEDYIEKLRSGGSTVVDVFDDKSRPIESAVGEQEVETPKSLDDIHPWSIKDGLDLMPGNLELYKLEMASGQGRENRLDRYMEEIPDGEKYDYVMIDTPPTPSAWMASALICSDEYLIPVKPDPISKTGIELLNGVVNTIKNNHGLNISLMGLVITIARKDTIVYEETLEYFEDNQKWEDKLFKNSIPKRTEVARRQEDQETILDSDDNDLQQSLRFITREFISRS